MTRFHMKLLDWGTVACIFLWLLTGCGTPATPNHRLETAIDKGDLEQVQQSINSGADSTLALSSAVRSKQINIARYLLSHGGDPNQQSKALFIYDFKVIDGPTNQKFALSLMADKDIILESCIDFKSINDHATLLALVDVLNKGQFYYEYKYNEVPGTGRTLIDAAIDNNDIEMVRLLIEYGADTTKSHWVNPALPWEPGTNFGPTSANLIFNTFLVNNKVVFKVSDHRGVFRDGFLLREGDLYKSTLQPVQGQFSTSLEYAT